MTNPFFPPEDKKESFVVPTSRLSAGRTEKYKQSAQNLVPLDAYKPETSYASMGQAMHGVGAELGNSAVSKDKKWWQKALGVLEPLKYLDIPIELLAQATIDPIAMATGRQLSPLRGSAEREHFESWKALFGGDISDETGWGEFKARIDKAADAFEKRPLKMQLGLMAAQIAATGGAAAIGKVGASATTLGGRAASRAGSIGLKSLDPTDVAFGAVGKGVKKGWSHSPWQVVSRAKLGQIVDADPYDIQDISDSVFEPVAGGSGPIPDDYEGVFQFGEILALPVEERALGSGWAIGDINADGGGIFPDVARYGPSNAIFPVPEENLMTGLPGYEDGLSPIMRRGNAIRKLFADLWKSDEALTGSTIDTVQKDVVNRSRDLALLHLILSTGSRPGSIQNVTVGELVKWIDDFKVNGQPPPLTIAGMQKEDIVDFGGKRVGKMANTVHVADYSAAFALDNYIHQLREQKLIPEVGKKLGKVEHQKVFELIDGKHTDSLATKIMNDYRGMGYDIVPEAQDLRWQRASEWYLEGWDIASISAKLNHADSGTTVGYIRDWTGNHTELADNYRLGFEIAASIPQEQLDAIQKLAGDNSSRLREYHKEIKRAIDAGEIVGKSGDKKNRAKGMISGFEEVNEVADVIGESYKSIFWRGDETTDLVKQYGLIQDSDYASYKTFLDHHDHPSFDAVKKNLQDVLSLIAMRNMSRIMRKAKTNLKAKHDGIYRNYDQSLERPKMYAQKKIETGDGILNRAGYYVDPKTKMLVSRFKILDTNIPRDAKAHKDWMGRRDELGEQLGHTGWTDKEWDDWAKKLWDERRKVDEALEEPEQWNKIRLGKGEEVGKRAGGLGKRWEEQGKADGGQIYEILEHYVDNHSPSVGGTYKDLHLKLDSEEVLVSSLPLEQLVIDLEEMGSGQALGVAMAHRKYGASWIKARNAFEKEVESSAALDPIVRGDARRINRQAGKPVNIDIDNMDFDEFVRTVPEVGFMDKSPAQQRRAVNTWLGQERVRAVMRGRRFYANMPPDKAKDRMFKLATENSGLFGNGFEGLNQAAKQRFIEQVSDHIFSQGSGGKSLAEIALPIRSSMPIESYGRSLKRRPGILRRRNPNVPDQLNGVNTRKALGTIQSPEYTTGYINKGRVAQAFNEFWNKKAWYRPPQPIVNGLELLGTMLFGGRALFSRVITKGISARSHNYIKAQENGIKATAVTRQVMRDGDLGLITDEATLAQVEQGIDQGNQFFGNIKVKDLADIEKWENSHKGTTKPNTHAKINGMLVGNPEDIKKWLTQVDVVMERIDPQHWDNYFELSTKQRSALIFMRDMLDEMDEIANLRGVNVKSRVKGKYLDNYFPRIYRWGRNDRLKQKAETHTVQNSFAQQFEARSAEDVLDQLLNPRRFDKSDATKTTVMEDVSERIGQYTETMWKEIIDEETIDWMRNVDTTGRLLSKAVREEDPKARSIFEEARGSKKDYLEAGELTTKEIGETGSRKFIAMRRLELDSLERIIRDKQKGVWEVDNKRQSYVLESSTPEIKEFEWAVLHEDNLERINKVGAGGLSEAQKILKWIEKEKILLENSTHKRWVSEVDGVDWLQSTLKTFSREDQKALRQMLAVSDDALATPTATLANIARKPTQIIRTFKAGFDLGVGLIHGFNSAVRIPLPGKGMTQGNFLKANKKQFELMLHPEHYDAWLVDNLDDINNIGQFVRLGHAEPVAQMQSDEWYQNFKRWLVKEQGGLGRPAIGKTMSKIQLANRFETGFTGFLDMLRVSNWNSMVPSVERKLKKNGYDMWTVDDAGNKVFNIADKNVRNELHELGAIVNKMTGVYDQHLAQVTPFQSLIESSLFFFAPMYRRATYGILFDIARGGMRTREALQQIGGVVTAGMIMGGLASKAQGNEEFLDLEKSYKFGKFEVNGVRMGIGTAWWTAFRVGADLALMASKDPEEEITDATFKDHPLFSIVQRRGRSQLAPGSSLAVDILSGKTFVGDPLRDEDGDMDWIGIGQHIGRSAVPFWLDGAFAGSLGAAAVAMPSEAFGLQAYPIQDYDVLSKGQQYALEHWEDSAVSTWREAQRKQGLPIDWTTASTEVKNRIYDFHPEVSQLYDNYKAKHGEIATGTARDMVRWSRQSGQLELEATQEITRSARQYMRGEIDSRDFRNAMSRVRSGKRMASNAMMATPEFQGVATFLSQLRNGRLSKATSFEGDLLYDLWVNEILASEDFNDEEGNMILGARDEAEMAFKQQYNINAEQWQYMQDRKNAWLNEMDNAGLHPVGDLIRAKESLKSYWDIHDRIWEPGSRMNAMAEIYYNTPEPRKESLKRQDKRYIRIEQMVSRERLRLRRNNLNIDRLLVEWYGLSPQNRINQMYEQSLRATQDSHYINGLPAGIPSDVDWEIRPSGRVSLKNRLTGVY